MNQSLLSFIVMLKRLSLLLLMAAITGCSHFKEVHYFKDRAGSPPNYYRLQVKGRACLTSSRYLSGYFDEEAVNTYFSEVIQPDKATFAANKPGGVEPLGKGLAGRRLVMILSSNSDAVATQIGSFVENKETLTALARLANRDRILAAQATQIALEAQRMRGQVLSTLGDRLMGELDSARIKPADAQIVLLQFLNALAMELGNQRPFASMEEAAAWMERNRGQLLSE